MLVDGLLIAVLAVIVYQDFQERMISSWILLLLGCLGAYRAFVSADWQGWFLLFNALFILIQLLGVSLYFSIKEQQWVNISQKYLGIGDILYFVVLLPFFSPVQFCCFFIGALILTVLGGLFYQWSIKPLQTIPLAGAMSLCLLGYQGLLWSTQYSFYNDWIFLQFIYG